MEINIKTPEQKEFEEIAKALVAIYAKLDPDARHEVFSYAAFYIPVVTVDRFTGETPTAYTLGTVKQYDYSVMEG